MKNIQILAALILVGILPACQKDQIEETISATPRAAAPVKRLSERNNLSLNDYIKMQYDAQGRTVRMEQEDSVYDINYTGSTVHIVRTETANSFVDIDLTGQLDDKGRIISASGFQLFVGVMTPVTYAFQYNNAGFMTQQVKNIGGQQIWVTNYTHANGNLSRQDVTYNGAPSFSGVYEYGNTADKLKLNMDRFFFGNTFTGKANKNLPTKYTGYDSAGQFSWSRIYTYSMDADGFPKQMEVLHSNGTYWLFEHIYE